MNVHMICFAYTSTYSKPDIMFSTFDLDLAIRTTILRRTALPLSCFHQQPWPRLASKAF